MLAVRRPDDVGAAAGGWRWSGPRGAAL